MKAAVLPMLVLLAGATALKAEINQSCKAGSDDASIVHLHGRLSVYNGGYPNLRLWQTGTHHLFGIYSDPADVQCTQGTACYEEADTKLPPNLERTNFLEFNVYGDFEIRLLKPFRQGAMQAACIVDAENIVRKRIE
jgi:hypothetical protein